MTTVQESATGNTPMADLNQAGMRNISYDRIVTFYRYVRSVLPMDGFVFWLRAPMLASKDSTFNSSVYNSQEYNGSQGPNSGSAIQLTVNGSLHETKQKAQNEDGSATVNSIVLTAENEIQEFNIPDPNVMWIGEYGGRKWAIGESIGRYQQAGLWHYRGRAIFSTLQTQIVDSAEQLRVTELVVSNSLPIWLSMHKLMPVYPSFAVPTNIKPPYAAVHVSPADTTAMQMAPLIDNTGSHWQLAHDKVKIDIYGLRNAQALDYQDYLFSAMTADDFPAGLMNASPIMQDEKVTQPEFQVLGQRKTFTLEVSYYQARMQAVAQQMIVSALCSVTITDNPF